MLRSLSFRQKPTQSLSPQALQELQRKIAVSPEPQDVLLWLKHVKPDRALLVVPEDESTGKPSYVKQEKPERLLMISRDPTRSMVALQDLFTRMLPAKAEVAPQVWRAAKPLKKLLASDEVKHQGVRNTQALIEALSALSRARQAQLDRQGVSLEPVPTEKEEEADPSQVALEQEAPLLQPEEVLAAWRLATAGDATTPAMSQPAVSHTSPPHADADDRQTPPTREKHPLVRRAKSSTLSKSSSLRRPPKDGAKD